MDRLTRRELKQDQLRTTFEEFEQFAKTHYREIVTVMSALIVILGLAAGLKLYNDRQEASANADLGAALASLDLDPSDRTIAERACDILAEAGDITRRRMESRAAIDLRFSSGGCTRPPNTAGLRA